MRSIFFKVLLWSLGTFALSLVAYWGIWRTLDRGGPPKGDPFPHLMHMVEDDLARAYETGGPEQLAAALRKLDSYLPAEHILVDARGRDLAHGVDRSDLVKPGRRHMGPPRLADGRVVFVGRPCGPGGQYRLIAILQPWFDRPNILPYYGAVVLVIALMGMILAAHLALPLRGLRGLVDRFGHGDLQARTHSTRKDEIGELSRAFDEMAGRIETLLAAERRLLLDVSHELRSPLTRLDVAVDLASTSDDPSEYLERIRRDVSRLSVLVNELLQLTRAEGDPQSHHVELVPLNELVACVVEDCSMEAEARGSSLKIATGPECDVMGEPELLRRAIENVVRNAFSHTPEGSTVEISLTRGAETATIAVRDRGTGVPAELLYAIFEPFFRVEGDRARATGGVGLGLAIARRAIDLHRGKISARNAAPGLLVSIELPLAVPAEVAS
jgi:signal transduction histidine kinase